MKVLGIVLAFIFCVTNSFAASAKNEVLVKFKTNQGISDQVLEEIPQLKIKRIKVADVDEALIRYSKNPNVEFVEKNGIADALMTVNDPLQTSQWYLNKISAYSAWDINNGLSTIIVAIADSGVTGTHPDLVTKMVPGWNIVDNNSDTHDIHTHGTHVAGCALAAQNNGIGIAGVSNNSIMPLMIAYKETDGSIHSYYSTMANAIVWATDHGAKVVNISYAGINSSSTLVTAVKYAWDRGVIVVSAAGNHGTDVPYYPANTLLVISAIATTSSDTKASFSAYGLWNDVSAPGASIYTTSATSYVSVNGTSFAAPITAATIGIIWSVNPELAPFQVVDALIRGCDDLGVAGVDPIFNNGRINIYKSVLIAQTMIPEPIVLPPPPEPEPEPVKPPNPNKGKGRK